jgi:hypothetical protein
MPSLSVLDWLGIIGFILTVLTTLAMKNKDIRLAIIRVSFLFKLLKFVAFFVLPVWGLYVLFVLIFYPGLIALQYDLWTRLLLVVVVIGAILSDIRDVLNADKRSQASLEFKESLNKTIKAGEE